MEEKKTKEKAFSNISAKSFLSVVIILSLMLLICGVLSLIIPQGSFLRDESGKIIAGTYTQGGVEGIAFWRIITAPVRVFFADGGITIIMISIFLLVMSGVFNLLEKTNGIKTIMNRMVSKFGKKKKLIICLCILFFMMFGSLFGLFEELITLLPFVIVFMLSLGFDTMTGLGVCLMASCFGFSAAITNPFSVGIASELNGTTAMDGAWLRIILFAIIYAVVCIFVLNYAKKVEKNPEKSISYEVDVEKRKSLTNTEEVIPNEAKLAKTYSIFFVVEFLILILVAVIRPISGLAIPILAVTFLVGGIVCGLIVTDNKKDTFIHMGKGALAMLPAVALIALASSINLVMQESGILDTIMNAVIGFLDGKSTFVCVLYIYLLVLILQVFIGSASAKIFLVMPILIPICQVIGISPNLLILIYCIADGFTDVILPTNPVLLIALSMSNISYGKWVKWTWLVQIIILIITLVVLFFGVQIGY